jgi:hypothetical protein
VADLTTTAQYIASPQSSVIELMGDNMKLENIASDHESRTQYIVQKVAMDLSQLSLSLSHRL